MVKPQDWLPILARVLQMSTLDPLLFLININNLPDSFRLFADNTSLFSKVYNSNLLSRQLSYDLQKKITSVDS